MVVIDRKYSGAAAKAVLQTAMTASSPTGGGTITVDDDSGWPTGGKFEVVIDRGEANEESILMASRSGTTFTISARGYDGTVASSHTSGVAFVEHDLSGTTMQFVVDHVDDVEANPHSTKLPVGTTAGHDVEARHTFGAALGTPVTPTALTPDIAGNAGTGNNPAREDHAHNVPAAVVGNIAPDDVAAEGSSGSFARADHTHGITAAVAGAIAPDDSAAEGVATSFSRSDHRHSIAAATATSITNSNAEGASTSFARADHNHAYGAASVSEAAIVGTMPRGIVAQQVLTTSGSTFTGDATSDFVLNNVSVVQDHVYAIHIHSATTFTPGGSVAEWNINLNVNGSQLATLYTAVAETTNLTQHPTVEGTVYWTAPATASTDDFTVLVNEFSGSFSFQFTATATVPRWFTITDLGVI